MISIRSVDIGLADEMERRVQCIPGGSENVQLVVRGQAETTQTRADLENALLVLLVGEEAVFGELKELPLFVDLANLAINVLLDLFNLVVRLDELAETDGIVVGVETGGALDNVEDGVNIVGRASEQTVLCARMATRNGLAGFLFVASGLNRVRRLVNRVQGHNALRVVNHDCRVCKNGRTLKQERQAEKLLQL